MMWLLVLGMFLLTAFVTWGLFANVEDADQARDAELREAKLAAAGGGQLSARLTEELRTIAETGGAVEEAAEEVARDTDRKIHSA